MARKKSFSLLAPRDATRTLTETGKARLATRMRQKDDGVIEDRLLRIIREGSDRDVLKAAEIYWSYAYGKPTEFTVSAKVSEEIDVPATKTLSTRELEEVANATPEDLEEAEEDAEISEPSPRPVLDVVDEPDPSE